MDEETLVYIGDTIKALGDGRIAGYLVRFTDAEHPDLQGDFFTKATDFDIESGDRITVYYNHGLDPRLKRRKLGQGAVRIDDVGVWVEAQLELRDEYERAVYSMVQAGKQGWSSGTLPHLVERVPVKKAMWIKHWPLGKDASLAPTPAAGPDLTRVTTLKSVVDNLAACDPSFGAFLPEAGRPPAAQDADGLDAAPPHRHINSESNSGEGINMDPENKQAEAPQDGAKSAAPGMDIAAMVEQAVAKALANLPVVNDPGFAAAKSANGAHRAPAHNKTGLGDSEVKAYAWFLKTGDSSGIKASNNTDMNVGTDADGGYAVPTGHYQGIIARRDEQMLAARLGVRRIPGKGTTVDVPLDGEADGEFVATNEAADSDRDAPALGVKSLTLVKYTKRVELSNELLEDDDSNILAFLNDFVGRGMAKTHNSLLLTEVGSNGTKLGDLTAAAIAAGELETIVGNDDLSGYLDDSTSVGWVMRSSTHWDIMALTGNDRLYAGMATGQPGKGMQLLGYPVAYSNKAAAQAANAKSVYFGNWNYVGYREAPGFTVLRDPYSLATKGQLVLHYYFRAVYGVLQAEAIGYGQHAAA